MTILKVSLSRAHKIAERLKDLAKGVSDEIVEKSSLVSFSSNPSSSTIDDLSSRGESVLALIVKADAYSKAWVSVRGLISKENSKRGIDVMLTELEAVNKMVASAKVMLATSKQEGYLPAEVASYEHKGEYRFNLTVNPVRSMADVFKKNLAQLQAKAIGLSDSIAEANAPHVNLDLTDEIAAEVTGSSAL